MNKLPIDLIIFSIACLMPIFAFLDSTQLIRALFEPINLLPFILALKFKRLDILFYSLSASIFSATLFSSGIEEKWVLISPFMLLALSVKSPKLVKV